MTAERLVFDLLMGSALGLAIMGVASGVLWLTRGYRRVRPETPVFIYGR